MPQMKPMNWLLLYLFLFFSLMIFMSNFSTFKESLSLKKKLNNKSMMLKW